MRNALAGDETSNYELEFETKDKSTRYLLVNATTRRDPDGKIVGVVGVAQDVTETKDKENAITAVAQELRQLVDKANAPIFGIDVNGLVNEWNDKTAEITGFSKEEAFSKPLITTFIMENLRDNVQAVMLNALQGEETSNYELEFETKDKSTRYLLVNATTRRDPDGKIVGVVGVAQDVTETKDKENAITAVARELRQLVDKANAPIFGIDTHGLVNEWNDKTAEITGFSNKEAFNKPLITTFIRENLRDNVQNVMLNALAGNETSNYELEFETKDKGIRYLLVNATTRRDPDGMIVGVVGVAQDVTETKDKENAITAVARELRQLVDTANAPIFGIDVNGLVNEWNDKTAEITGFSKEEAFAKPLITTFIKENLRENVQSVMQNALRGVQTSNYELEFETKDKSTRYLLVNATTRKGPDGTIVGVVGVAQDVTDDRNHSLELQRVQSQRASQEAKVETERNMTAYFAHELRNPLHAIDMALTVFPAVENTDASELVSSMKLCTSFMSTIMNNLLDVRKMEEGKMKLNLHPTCISEMLTAVHGMLLPSVQTKVDFVIDCRTTPQTDWMLSDSHRLQQIITNVITNAIKYTKQGHIKLIFYWDTETRDGVFECADTGPGIPKHQQESLFKRFVQRGGAPGTGLGLAIAKHLVELANGSIRFHSDPTVRPGTSCVVRAPFEKCLAPERVIANTSLIGDSQPVERECRILIIDDVRMNRTMLSKRISKKIAPNAIIKEAKNGEEALEIIETDRFDVIIVDQFMEESGGVLLGTELIAIMRENKVDSLIIGCSGNEIHDKFVDAGCQYVWGKPMPSNEESIGQIKRGLGMMPFLVDGGGKCKTWEEYAKALGNTMEKGARATAGFSGTGAEGYKS
jgi:PAS domain S-box-containing protein